MILLVVLILIFVTIVAAIVYSHHAMKQKWEDATGIDVLFAREAIQNSVYASNSTNIPLALLEVQSACAVVDMLCRRYKGVKNASEVTGIDMKETNEVLLEQRDKILQELVSKYPDMLPDGELIKYTGYIKKRQESKNAGVPHFDPKDEEQLGLKA